MVCGGPVLLAIRLYIEIQLMLQAVEIRAIAFEVFLELKSFLNVNLLRARNPDFDNCWHIVTPISAHER